MSIARVALDLPLSQAADYLAGDAEASDVGRLVSVRFGRREFVGVLLEIAATSSIDPAKLKPLLAIRRDLPALPRRWLEMLQFCAGYYQYPVGEAMAAALPPGLRRGAGPGRAHADPIYRVTAAGREALAALRPRSISRRLIEALAAGGALPLSVLRRISAKAAPVAAGLLNAGQVEIVVPDAPPPELPRLLPEQTAAVEVIAAGWGAFSPCLLHGVTGSGKTEVYLRLIAAALERGRQALMLVPEIALTPQLEARVAARFPAAHLVALHSGLAAGARSRSFVAAWWGEADIVLGTRLAVFTPLPRLGLVVVDEEHDASFKQQDGMRYSARDMAVWRARQEAVPIVLGSATPSLESWHHATSGRYRLVSLTRRALSETMPQVRCVDTRRRKLDHGLAPELLAAVAQRLERGEQSLIFLNRRGYAPVLACAACGWVSRCSHCSANQVLHLADRRLRCHHCGAENRLPAACPDCGNQDLQPYGRGTQRLEEVFRERLPAARVLRVDRDSAGSPRRWADILDTIRAGGADILIGTQMLAKGHDFPRLTLVGVLNADASLFAADFRAPERLFAQLLQVGGRSGRAELPGEVLIQTEHPDHALYAALADHDYARFAAGQLAERRQAGFPPFTFQALLAADAPAMSLAIDFLGRARALGLELAPAGLQLYDPVPMRLARRADRERAQLLVEAARRPVLQQFLAAWSGRLAGLAVARELRWHIDVDPSEF